MLFSKNTSLRYKIFVAIVSVNLLFMAFMAAFNFYRESVKISISKKQELKNTQNKVQETFSYIIRNTSSTNKAEINRVLDTRIFEISNINNVGITVYDLKGNVITSSRVDQTKLDKSILDYINKKKAYFAESIDSKDKDILHYNSFDFLKEKKT